MGRILPFLRVLRPRFRRSGGIRPAFEQRAPVRGECQNKIRPGFAPRARCALILLRTGEVKRALRGCADGARPYPAPKVQICWLVAKRAVSRPMDSDTGIMVSVMAALIAAVTARPSGVSLKAR